MDLRPGRVPHPERVENRHCSLSALLDSEGGPAGKPSPEMADLLEWIEDGGIFPPAFDWNEPVTLE